MTSVCLFVLCVHVFVFVLHVLCVWGGGGCARASSVEKKLLIIFLRPKNTPLCNIPKIRRFLNRFTAMPVTCIDQFVSKSSSRTHFYHVCVIRATRTRHHPSAIVSLSAAVRTVLMAGLLMKFACCTCVGTTELAQCLEQT